MSGTRIEDVKEGRLLRHVGLRLTTSEIAELRDSLALLLEGPPERHEHVSSADYQTEITVWLDSESR